MTTHFKITRSLIEQIQADLCRPHPFAFERVGFLFVRPGTASVMCYKNQLHNLSDCQTNSCMKATSKWYSWLLRWRKLARPKRPRGNNRIAESRIQKEETLMILAVSYFPVRDGDYIDDPTVGAKIGSAAIRCAMQRSLDTGMGVIHIHMHEGTGTPEFSLTDKKSMNKLMPSFLNVSPNVPHGALVINQDSVTGLIWKDNKNPHVITKTSVIGYPCRFNGGVSYV